MKSSRLKFFVSAFVVLLFLGFGYYHREDAGRLLEGYLSQFRPCQKPIMYSIANLDPNFGLTEAELLDGIKQAEKIWEVPVSKQLFEYSPTGDLKISLVYDYRQKSTDSLREIGIVINDDRSTYDILKAKYESLIISYDREKARIDTLVSAYNTDKNSYEKDVNLWNRRGGAPKVEHDILEQKRIDLNDQIEIINQAKDSLNNLVDIINSTSLVLNKLVAVLNLQVDSYNAIGVSINKEFSQGEYVSGAKGTAINIFQFNDTDQLVRVLAHELGHALGLGHLDNPKAIMYYLNEGINMELTEDDLTALKNICEIK